MTAVLGISFLSFCLGNKCTQQCVSFMFLCTRVTTESESKTEGGNEALWSYSKVCEYQ